MRAYLYARRRVIAAFLLFAAVFGVVFWLGGVPMGAVGYASAICGVLALAFGCADFLSFRQRCAVLKKLQDEITVSVDNLPEPQNAAEEGCAELLRALFRSRAELQEHYEQSISDMTDYYTMWAHQIKTPIAAMRLSLAEQDSPESRSLAEELTRIEQYVEMLLCYIRLESSDTDYVIKECRLEDIVKSAVRRFSGQFIRKKLTLQMSGLDRMVLTDEKWLLFVIGQVLSRGEVHPRRRNNDNLRKRHSENTGHRYRHSPGGSPEDIREGLHRVQRQVGHEGERAGAVPLQADMRQAGSQDIGGKQRRHVGFHRPAAQRGRPAGMSPAALQKCKTDVSRFDCGPSGKMLE